MSRFLILLLFPFLVGVACERREKERPNSSLNAMELRRLCQKTDLAACRMLCIKYRSLPACESSCKVGDQLSCKRRDALAAERAPKEVQPIEKVGVGVGAWVAPPVASTADGWWQKTLFGFCRGGHQIACDTMSLYYPVTPKDATMAKPFTRDLKALCEEERQPLACAVLGSMELIHNMGHLTPQKAFTHFALACDLSKGRWGCDAAGRLGLHGVGTNKDEKRALALLTRGCRAKNSKSCRHLARYHAYAESVKWSLPTVEKALNAACRAGDKKVCGRLKCRDVPAQSKLKRRFPIKAAAKLYALFERHCRAGVSEACLQQYDAMASGMGVRADAGAALKGMTALCDKGHPAACFRGGTIMDGPGGPTGKVGDPAALFSKGCDLGLPSSCFMAGTHFRKKGDAARSLKSVERGCALGDMSSCAFMGEQFALGAYGAKNVAKAKTYLERACQTGHIVGCQVLVSTIMREGLLDVREKSGGYDRVRPLCALRVSGMCGYLGLIVGQGWGVEADLKEGRRLASRMCTCGEGAGCYAAGTLGSLRRRRHNPYVRSRGRGAVKTFERGCKLGHGGACAEFAKWSSQGYRRQRRIRSTRTLRILRKAREAAEIGCTKGWEDACLMKKTLAR